MREEENTENAPTDEDYTCPCTSEYVSSYWLSPPSTVPGNIVEFNHSFGYNCKKIFNLVLIDPDCLVYSSGNFVHYYQISTKTLTFQRTAGGGGIGFILKNPNPVYNYLTVLENGVKPLVIIYKYPENEIISVLENGAERSFTCATYSTNGELLATQSGDPDYMLTIWKWSTSSIILRTKSFQNDVLNVVFSPHNPILLTTCGLGHIKFWKMARTFTGLKLQGDLGRYGKTEFSDIYAIYPMFDEKVISGCEWGNMLVWDAGLIKLEVCRKNRKTCHNAPITFITMENGEVMTAGMDGYIRIWFWETVELADPPDDDRFVEIEPIYEFYIGNKDSFCEIRCLIKVKPLDETDFAYYAQDGNGGIWYFFLDRETVEPIPPAKIFHCHGGKIMAADSSPISPHIVTLGEDGRMHIYNYKTKKLVYQKQYPSGGTDLIWLTPNIEPTGVALVMSFADGIIRQVVVEFSEKDEFNVFQSVHHTYLIDVFKAHETTITKLSINPREDTLVSGSADKTLFIHLLRNSYEIPYVMVIPIGFIQMPSIPTAMNWKNNDNIIIVGCSNGEVIETELPTKVDGNETTYLLAGNKMKIFRFHSVKSKIRRQIVRDFKANKLEAKRQKKLAELRKLKEANPAMELDENMTFEDSEDEEEEPPLYIPPAPNPILWLQYTPSNTIWLSMGGYDAGYIYEVDFKHGDEPARCTIIADGDDVEIYSYYYIDRYFITGVQGGHIRINAIKQSFRDLSDYWIMGMHDNFNSHISKIFFGYRSKSVFSIGYDGNIFAYDWNGPIVVIRRGVIVFEFVEPDDDPDIEDPNYPSLEQQRIKAERDRKLKISNERKALILEVLDGYRQEFIQIEEANKEMAISQHFTQQDLELDPRITQELIDSLKVQLALVRRKLEFEVERAKLGREKVMDYFIDPLEHLQFEVQGIRKNFKVTSFKLRRLDDDIEDTKLEIEERLRRLGRDRSSIGITDSRTSLVMSIPAPPEEKFFFWFSPEEIAPKFTKQMLRILNRYRQRKLDGMRRYVDWEKIKHKRPDPNKNHIDDVRAIAAAQKTIGDYKLKTDPEFEPKSSDNTLNKYKELLRAREELFHLRNDFNLKLFQLREKKKIISQFMEVKRAIIDNIHKEIPESERVPFPENLLADVIITNEYPEILLSEKCKPGTGLEVEDVIEQHMKAILPKEQVVQPKLDKELIANDYQTFDENDELLSKFRAEVLGVENVESLPDFNELSEILQQTPPYTLNSMDEFEKYALEPDTSNKWANEMRYDWILNRIIEQKAILQHIDVKIVKFEKELQELEDTKLNIEKDAKFLELYLITLCEELSVLKDCEQLETDLSSKTNNAFNEKTLIQTQITDMNRQMEDIRKNTEKMAEQVKVIQNNFLANIKGNKFFDFLRRIFKKRYRPPKVQKDDSDESSSSEDSTTDEEEDEDDTKSMESLDMQPIRLDEQYCPVGCDVKLYDLAFAQRSERHLLEQSIMAQNKYRDELKKEVDDFKNQLKKLDIVYLEKKNNLLAFRREKQQVLNKVDALVIIHLDQMQYVKEGESPNGISQALLFDSENIVKLHSRVGQLNLETLETKRLHRINIVHLQRMTTDCRYMQQQINNLEADIKIAMEKKFGFVVDIDELEESILRQYVYKLMSSMEELRKNISQMVNTKKDKLDFLKGQLIKDTQCGTEKLNILTVLQEEKNFLLEILNAQAKRNENPSATHHVDFRYDLKKLRDIDNHQQAQIQFLERELRTLRQKSAPLTVQTIESRFPESGTTEENQQDEDQPNVSPEYETNESDFIGLQSIAPMAHKFDPDVYTGERIAKVVQKFLIQYVGNEMPEDSIRKYTEKLSKYLGYVAKNIETDEVDEIMKCVEENIKMTLPQKYLLHILPENIHQLFQDILAVFQHEKINVDIDEVLEGIVMNAYEVSTHYHNLNVTQDIVTEALKEIIEVLTASDIRKTRTVNRLCRLLSGCAGFKAQCINVIVLVQDVMKHAKDNLIDEFTQQPIRDFVDAMVIKLKRIQEKRAE